MPFASAGANISDSAQINPGVITNSDVSDSAAIAYSKLDLSGAIKATDIENAAGLPDSKLAQITTAGKVDGAALTGLASIPSGAGKIPAANLNGIKLSLDATTSEVGRSSISEATLKTYTLPGGTLGTANAIRIDAYLKLYEGSAGGSTHTIRFKYGSTTIASFGISLANNTTYNMRLTAFLIANAATNAQTGNLSVDGLVGSTAYNATGRGTATEDSTGNLAVAITGQNTANNANAYIQLSDLVITSIG